jgi:hypothetical protein
MGFNMKVLYASRSRASDAMEQEFRASYVDKQTLLRESDVVTLHLPLFPETRHYIGGTELALMKKSAILVNASRGPIVDEKALVRALKAGRIAGAGLDVYENEPALAPGLAQLPNVVLTPHVGSGTYATRLKMSNMAVANCIAGLTGQRPPNLLNRTCSGPPKADTTERRRYRTTRNGTARPAEVVRLAVCRASTTSVYAPGASGASPTRVAILTTPFDATCVSVKRDFSPPRSSTIAMLVSMSCALLPSLS